MFKAGIVALGIGCFAPPAIAERIALHCVDVSAPKGMVSARHGRWVELTGDQGS